MFTRRAATLAAALFLISGCKAPSVPTAGSVSRAGQSTASSAARSASSSASAASSASDSDFEIAAVPTNVDQFLALRDELATTPHGGAVLHVLAQLIYTQNPELGLQCFTICLEQQWLVDGDVYRGKAPGGRYAQNLQRRLGENPHIARSYVQGTSPEDGYALPAPPLVIRIKEQHADIGDEASKVFVYSTGADSARPIRLVKNNRGIWKSNEWSSLEVGVRPPVEHVDDDF